MLSSRRLFTPGAHQDEMMEFAYGNYRCAWWAGMGSGKTSAAETVLHNLELLEPGRSLVMAPLRVARDTWPNEARSGSTSEGMSVCRSSAHEAERIAALKLDVDHATPINYDVLPWLIEYLITTSSPGAGRAWWPTSRRA
jgi:uncharacterized protein YodC (DUF2158 family)